MTVSSEGALYQTVEEDEEKNGHSFTGVSVKCPRLLPVSL